jgi:hypothetical protein
MNGCRSLLTDHYSPGFAAFAAGPEPRPSRFAKSQCLVD